MAKLIKAFVFVLCIYVLAAMPLDGGQAEEAPVNLLSLENNQQQDAVKSAVSQDLTRARRQFGNKTFNKLKNSKNHCLANGLHCLILTVKVSNTFVIKSFRFWFLKDFSQENLFTNKLVLSKMCVASLNILVLHFRR